MFEDNGRMAEVVEVDGTIMKCKVMTMKEDDRWVPWRVPFTQSCDKMESRVPGTDQA